MDTIDVAQRRQQEDIELALQSRRQIGRGLEFCEAEDCGEQISEQRQAMGARRCVPCATAAEKGAQRWQARAHG